MKEDAFSAFSVDDLSTSLSSLGVPFAFSPEFKMKLELFESDFKLKSNSGVSDIECGGEEEKGGGGG